MSKLRADAEKFPIYHALIVLFLSVGLCGIPLGKLFELLTDNLDRAFYLEEIFKRAVISAIGIVFIYKYGFENAIKNKVKFLSFFAVIPAILVAINNFPIIGILSGNAAVVANTTDKFLFLIYCLFIALFEEVVFRGIVFPLCFIKLKSRKNCAFWSVALSSALFSLTHLLNLFSGASVGGTVLQVGYSFLIGAMCAICLSKTGSLIIPVILHFVYDVGGMLLGEHGIAVGSAWDTLTVVITAILSVIVIIYMVAMILKIKENDLKAIYYQ